MKMVERGNLTTGVSVQRIERDNKIISVKSRLPSSNALKVVVSPSETDFSSPFTES